MKQNDTHKEEVLSDLLVLISVGCIVLAGVGTTGYIVWLAATQWLLVACILMLFAIYFNLKK